MEQLVRAAICKYHDYVAEAQLYEKWAEQTDETEAKKQLELLNLKIVAINSWLTILSTDERFVVQKHLIEELEWARIAFEYRERWKKEFERTERTLQIYQANALAKIAEFARRHKTITLKLFADVQFESGQDN